MQKLIILLFSILITTGIFGQKTKKDTLKTEEILVVKPYTPKISDAFKITTSPILPQSDLFKKEAVSYSIFSIPVASTFTPSKGKAKGITRAPKERLFENYISAGFGNFTSPSFEAYIHAGDNRYNDFGIFINHYSSEGGIKDLVLNDNFSDTKIDLYYKQFERNYNWQVNGGVQRQLYNYYGLPKTISFNDNVISSLNEQQLYKAVYLGGKINFEESFFKGATAEATNFSDDYNSNEIRFLVKPKIEFPISTELLNATFLADLISGKFEQTYLTSEKNKYNFLNLGVNPNFEVLREKFTLNLGAKFYYSRDLETKTNTYYTYPNVTASYKVIEDVLIITAGVTGDLEQNSYKNFAEENPYVSPTLNIFQTDQQYRAFLGTKGKLASNIGYNFNISHSNEKNKALYIQNPRLTEGTIILNNAYEAGNSFNVVYDNIKTLGAFAEVSIDASKEFNFSGTLNYYNYTTENLLEAWNLPTITATVNANYKYKSWYAGAKLFYRSETKDLFQSGIEEIAPIIVKNKAYIDLNLNGGYIFSNRLTAFAKINNALGTKYESYLNYQVQPLQISGGITYKFDL